MCHKCNGSIKRVDEFSADGSKRYIASRHWNIGPACVVVLANPSRFDSSGDNPTTKAIMAIACRNGYGAVHILNLDPRMSTRPLVDFEHDAANHRLLTKHARGSFAIWVAWGDAARHLAAGKRRLLASVDRDFLCIGVTADGAPYHPARKSHTLQLRSWRQRNERGGNQTADGK